MTCLNQNKVDLWLTSVFVSPSHGHLHQVCWATYTRRVSSWWLIRPTLNHISHDFAPTRLRIKGNQQCVQAEELRRTWRTQENVQGSGSASGCFMGSPSSTVWSLIRDGLCGTNHYFQKQTGWKDWRSVEQNDESKFCVQSSEEELERTERMSAGGLQWDTLEVLKYRLLTGEAVLFSNCCSFCLLQIFSFSLNKRE